MAALRGDNRSCKICALAKLVGSFSFILLLWTSTIYGQSVNPIVLENQQPGSDQWELQRAGFLIADDVAKQIKGYASATSVNLGESLTLYATVSPSQTYTVDIYRLG